jgi:hypothetical protein
MATVTSAKSTQLTALEVTEPREVVDAGVQHASVRHAYAAYAVDAADEIGSDGVIQMLKLPKGARIVDAAIKIPASGATGQFDVGWAAGAEGDLAADQDALFAGLDPGDAAVDSELARTSAAYMKKLEEEATIQLTCLEATADSGGDEYELSVFYVID